MKIYMIRHGETDWNQKLIIQGQTDIELNNNGIKQAYEAAETLKNMKLSVSTIYSSPQKRALLTADIIGEALGLSVKMKEGIQEICFGDWEGLTWEQVEEKYPEEYQKWHMERRSIKTPNGESYQELLQRTTKALQEIVSEQNEDVIVVSHSAVIMTLRCFLDDAPFHEMVKKYRLGNAQVFSFESNRLLKRIKDSL